MGFGDFVKNVWGATEKEAKEGMAEASHAITTAAKDLEDVGKSVEQEVSKGVATAIKDAENAVAATKEAAGKTAKTLVADPIASAAAGVNDYLAKHQVAKKLGQLSSTAAKSANAVLAKVKKFGNDAIASIEAQCPFAGASILLSTMKKNQDLLNAARNKGLQSNPKVIALKNMQDAMAKALMSDDVYSETSKIDIPGYTRMDPTAIDNLFQACGASNEFNSESPNFHAALYKSNDKPTVYTLAFRGTDPFNPADLATNVQQARGLDTPAYNSAITLASALKNIIKLEDPNASLEVTGHSLGGGLAEAASSATGAKGTTYNAAGLSQYYIDKGQYSNDLKQNLVNYHVDGEILTTAQDLVPGIPTSSGQQVALPAPMFAIAAPLPLAVGVLASPLLGPGPAAALAGSIALHKMGSVEDGMVNASAEQQSAVSKLVGGT